MQSQFGPKGPVAAVCVSVIYEDGSGELFHITQQCLQRSQIMTAARRWQLLYSVDPELIYPDQLGLGKAPIDKCPPCGGN